MRNVFRVADYKHFFDTLEASRKITNGQKYIDLCNSCIEVKEPFIFDERDSNLTIMERVVLSEDINPFCGNLMVTASMQQMFPRASPPMALTVDGIFKSMSRFPEDGFLDYLAKCDMVWRGSANGTAIKGNYICNISSEWAHGVYYDEMSFNCSIEDNIFENVISPIQLHISQKINIVRNIAVNLQGDIYFTPVKSIDVYLKNNVFYSSGNIYFLLGNSNEYFNLKYKDVFLTNQTILYSEKNGYYYGVYKFGKNDKRNYGPFPDDNEILHIDPKIQLKNKKIVVLEDSPLKQMNFNIISAE